MRVQVSRKWCWARSVFVSIVCRVSCPVLLRGAVDDGEAETASLSRAWEILVGLDLCTAGEISRRAGGYEGRGWLL